VERYQKKQWNTADYVTETGRGNFGYYAEKTVDLVTRLLLKQSLEI